MLQKISPRAGFVTDTTEYSNQGGWFDGDHVRFNNGLPEKIRGWEKTYSAMEPLAGVCRKLFSWTSLSGIAYLAMPTSLHFYVDKNGVIFDISPIRRDLTLGTDPISTVSGESYIIVNDTNHGVTVDDFVNITGSGAVGGLSTSVINDDHQVIEVLDADTYILGVSASASSTATGGGGSVVATYSFQTGSDSVTYAAGFGTGFYGGAESPEGTFNLPSDPLTTNTGTNTTVSGIPVTEVSVEFPTDHNAEVGDWVILEGATATGGLSSGYLNRAHEVISITDADTLVLRVIGVASGSTTAGGSGIVASVFNSEGLGWGEGADISLEGFSGLWTVDNYGEDLVACARSLISDITLGASPIATTNGSASVVVTHDAHGYVAGQAIVMSGAVAVGGLTAIQLNRTHTLTSVTTNTYTFTAPANASSDATGGGSNVRIFRPTIFYWDIDEDRMKCLTDLGSAYAKKYVPYAATEVLTSNTNRKVILFGCNPFDASLPVDKMLVRWSDSRDPTNYDASDTTTSAGENRLSSGSYIVTALQTREEILIWTDTSLYAMVDDDPPYHFAFNLIGANYNIVGPNAKAVAGGSVYWMGTNGFYRYNGAVEVLPCPVRDYVFNDINRDRVTQISAGSNVGNGEVMWLYPSEASEENDRYVIFNYEENVWYFGTTIQRSAWLDADVFQYPRAVGVDGFLYTHERGWDDGSTNPSSPITAFIQSSPIEIGEGDHMMFCHRIIPDISFLDTDLSLFPEPVVKFQLKARNFPGGPIVTENANQVQRVSGATLKINRFTNQTFCRVRGRAMMLRVESDGIGVGWRLGMPRIDIREDGRK